MEGLIASFRRGRHTQYHNQMIVLVDKIENKVKAASLVGKKVMWKSPAGKEIKGKVGATHGSKGALRVLFETGMPGQSLGSKVTVD